MPLLRPHSDPLEGDIARSAKWSRLRLPPTSMIAAPCLSRSKLSFLACSGIDKIAGHAREDPEQSRSARSGRYIIEVFPALALAFNSAFFGRLRGPKYNPVNKRKFRTDDWIAVVETVGRHAQLAGIIGIEAWAKETKSISSFRKADQDRLDAVLCALVGYQWLRSPAKTQSGSAI